MKVRKPRVLLLYPNEPMVGVTPSNLAILSAFLKNAGFDTKLFDCGLYKSIRYESEEESDETQDKLREKLGHVKKSPIDEYVHLKENDIYEDFVGEYILHIPLGFF